MTDDTVTCVLFTLKCHKCSVFPWPSFLLLWH